MFAGVEERENNYGRLMLIQGAMISGAMEVEIFCFYFLKQIAVKFAGKKAEIPAHIIINCYVVLFNCVLPTVCLIFVKRFRANIRLSIEELLKKARKAINLSLFRTKIQTI